MFHFTQTKQSSCCLGSKSKQLCFFRVNIGKGLDVIMSLCLEGSTFSAALPVPPKNPMDLSGEEDALQSLELTPNSRMWPGLTTSLISFEAQVSWA